MKHQPGVFPISYEAERAVLAAALTNKRAIPDILSAVTPDDFMNSEHQSIFRIVAELYVKQDPIDIVTVSTAYRKKSPGKQIALEQMFKHEFSGAYRTHIRELKDCSRRRGLLSTLHATNIRLGGSESVDDIVAELLVILQRSDNGTIKRPITLDRAILMTLKQIEQASVGQSKITGIPTGYTDFDKKIGGIQPGELMLVGARPSVGKSALLAGIALGSARLGYPSVIVNAEMELVSVCTRMLAAGSGIANVDLRRGDVDEHDLLKLIEASKRLAPLPVWIYDDVRWEVIQAQIRALKMHRKDLAVVVIDYVQRIRAQHHPEERRYETLGRIAREAKDLAKELKIGVILAAQIDRRVSKEGKEPELADLRESGDLEQEADIIGFLHCYKPRDSWNVHWLIKKNRNGPTGFVRLKFIANQVAFYDWESEPDDNK